MMRVLRITPSARSTRLQLSVSVPKGDKERTQAQRVMLAVLGHVLVLAKFVKLQRGGLICVPG
jgi:hypothetical protein